MSVTEIEWSTTHQWRGKPDEVVTDKGRFYEYCGEWISLGKKWSNVKSTLPEWWDAVTVDGLPIGPKIDEEDNEDQTRSMRTFRSHQLALVDIDSGLTIEELKEQEFYQEFAAGYYTTPSHTDELHKFRIVFVLESAIRCPTRMRHLYISLIAMFNSDAACKDSSRLFFGSVNCGRKSFDPSKRLTDDIVDLLVQWSKDRETVEIERQQQTDYELPTDADKRNLIEKLKGCYLGQYDDWMRTGFGMKNSGFTVEDFIEVSLAATNSKTPARCRELWKSSRYSGKKVMYGSLVWLANNK